MTNDSILQLHSTVLAGMREMGPKRLVRSLDFHAEDIVPIPDASEDGFRSQLLAATAGDRLTELWRKSLAHWDFADNPAWATTLRRTTDRRTEIYDLLFLTAETRKVLDELVPVAAEVGPTVISETFTPWYSPGSQQGRAFYWPAYARMLEAKGWSPEAVAGIDDATTKVVERLADPAAAEAYQSKGLVVGYVQSGKTANFTGVVAKAIDSGYRLIIVLGGTLNLLRAQTQRRLDMELVGEENILEGADRTDLEALAGIDYQTDEDWIKGKFIRHGGLPSLQGAVDITRMTTRDYDFKRLLRGISALDFKKHNPALPLHDPQNLHRSAACLMVVKKNKSVLTNLVNDLKKIRTPRDQIPVLIIDDESDQASVNTSNPKKWKEGKVQRTAINKLISELLELLPRAQYVGYTATPFANVFIDPSDSVDIFPRDFIISLDRPQGYMGVQEFHDLESDIPEHERTVANSQEKAFVRGIAPADDDDDSALQRAVDMFVLTAAVKLYRRHHGPDPEAFRHHTMLVHESVLKADHRDAAERIRQLWFGAGYTGPTGQARLRSLFDTDLAPVSAVRADGAPTPTSFEQLIPYLGSAYFEITGAQSDPVLVVNGDAEIEHGTADFDQRPIWKILVGGTKLSRGFTVEGLTITYYRRTTAQADTLMQMGRWFGFRQGYQDLVRLYIGRSEAFGAKTVDLYEAFEAICRDEEAFRDQLRKYAELVDGAPQVTPAQVPPLVAQHLPWLRPTGQSKMFNAELVEIRSPGEPHEPTAYPLSQADLRANVAAWRPLLDHLDGTPSVFNCPNPATGQTRPFTALTGLASRGEVLSVLEELRWLDRSYFAPHLEYVRGLSEASLVDDWLIIAPQLTARTSVSASILGSRPLTLAQRQRRRDPLFGAISEGHHRPALSRLAGAGVRTDDPMTESLVKARRGVLALYPVVTSPPDALVTNGAVDPSALVMAFVMIAPASARQSGQKMVRFRTIDSSRSGQAIIDTAAH
ncbi:Z1 domain-containing protein [Kitasatospora sp. NPDC057223]|uniref:Z1 domain-containing protein n=1 Tax=Kitasatospora sp. NPDC057223 TaxID=3346055 RepID=UPI00362FBCE4